MESHLLFSGSQAARVERAAWGQARVWEGLAWGGVPLSPPAMATPHVPQSPLSSGEAGAGVSSAPCEGLLTRETGSPVSEQYRKDREGFGSGFWPSLKP